MRFSFPCRFYFFCGWFAWLLGAWALLASVFTATQPDLLSNYSAFAWASLLAPFLVIAVADRISIRIYEGCWHRINTGFLGPMLLDRETLSQLRHDVLQLPVIRWLAPREAKTVGRQILAIAMWWPALLQREGSFRQRFGEALLDTLAIAAGLPLAGLMFLCLPAAAGLPLGLAFAAAALLILGHSLVRLAGRQQAVLDYFEAWRTHRMPLEEEA